MTWSTARPVPERDQRNSGRPQYALPRIDVRGCDRQLRAARLPFRDVFDSAFDEVVRVPYLTVKQARMPLDGRVTDVPVPFLVLAYCQSGGLPRDLLRATDRILSLAGRDGAALDLAAITRHVVHQDLAGKTEAVTSVIKSIGVEPHVSDALRCFQNLDKCAPGGPRRVPCLLDEAWLKGLEQLSPILMADDSDDVSDRRQFLRLTDVMTRGASAGGGERERFPGRQESVSLAHLRSQATWENGS